MKNRKGGEKEARDGKEGLRWRGKGKGEEEFRKGGEKRSEGRERKNIGREGENGGSERKIFRKEKLVDIRQQVEVWKSRRELRRGR